MILIGSPYIENKDDKSRLVCDISVDDREEKIYVEVDNKYSDYLCYERCDAFLIVLFYYAMRNNHDIVCKGPISEDLLYQITEYLIPILKNKSHNKLSDIKIFCTTAPNIKNEGAVGTSVTGGVDSFYTIINNKNNNIKSKKLTHLTIMNPADSYKKEGRYTYIMDYLYQKAERIAKEFDLPLIKIKSNMRNIFPIPPMHTLIRMFGVYSLQKLFGTYYFSSGYPIWTFNIEDSSLIDSARYDLLLCKELSTKNLFVYSEGSQKSRLEKLEYISSKKIVRDNLHVCSEREYNCCLCDKCVRTILELDSIGKLENFRGVFDVDFYYDNQDYYFNEAVRLYNKGDIFVYDFIDKLKHKYNSEILNKVNNDNICDNCFRIADYNLYKKNKKFIIGVSGGSGSGKTKIVECLQSRIHDSHIINVDKYMIELLDKYKEQIIGALGICEDGKHWCNYIYNNPEDVKKWINIIKEDINNCITTEMNKTPNSVIIVDSFMLPLLSIFNDCDISIKVKSDANLKLLRLKRRLHKIGRLELFTDKSLINRLINTEMNEYDNYYDYEIINDNNILDLSESCDNVLKKIKI